MATEFMSSSSAISTTMAPAAAALNSVLGSCVQVKIWMGRAVKLDVRPSGLNRGRRPRR